MKKLIAVCLLSAMLLVCAGCGSASATTTSAPVPTAAPEIVHEDVSVQQTESTAQGEAEKEESEQTAANTVLVVYFSATGTTRGVAEKIAALTGAELAEIIPAQPYTDEDLNYSDRSTRATVEQNTPDARPEIANDISLDGYTTVYLGYPIWWGQAPRIMSSFVESHDFTGITVIPFCTSGGSGAGRTGETLGEQAGTGTFLSSTRLSAGISDSDLNDWISNRK
jgi:flavodoxin